MFTSVSSGTIESSASLVYPGPPLNSPLTQSEIGDRDNQHDMSMSNLTLKLKSVPGRLTPPHSEHDHEGMSAPGVYVRDFGVMRPPKPQKKTALTLGALRAEGNMTTPSARLDAEDAKPGLPEFSVWEGIANEDVGLALKRLVMVARDMHQLDKTKSVKQHYSERLHMLLKQSEIEFDCSDLH